MSTQNHVPYTLPATRLVCRYRTYGGPEALDWYEEPLRHPGPGEVTVAVRAVSVNPVDWKVLDGRMKPITPIGRGPFKPRGFGSDYSGTVVRVGPGVKNLSAGDAVMGMMNPLSSGTWATHLIVPALWAAKAPRNVDLGDVAGLPAAGITALRIAAKLPAKHWNGAKVLLNGAAGGVGSLTLQILSHMGAHVHAVASASRHAGLLKLGAESCSDYRSAESPGARFDAVIDAHGSLLHTNPRLFFAKDSHIKLFLPVSIPNAFIPISLFRGFGRAFAGIQTRMVLAVPSRALLDRLTELVTSGHLLPVIDTSYDRVAFRDAVTASISGHGFGKLIVRVEQ